MQVGENIVIKKLSGPVSYSILEPKIENYSDYDAPVIILFGDIHGGIGGECKDEDSYAIYKSNFLKAINSIANKYPIDFNFEYYFSSEDLEAIKTNKVTKITHQNTTPFNKFLINNHACFFKNLKNKTNCPDPNVRFHYVDIRMPHSKSKYNYEYEILQFFTEGTFLRLANGKQIYTDNLNQVIGKIRMILTDIINKTTTFMDHYFDNIDFTTRSFVYKQISKQKDNLKRISIWKKWFKEYYFYIISSITDTKISELLQVFNTLISKLNKAGYTPITRDMSEFVTINKPNFDRLTDILVNVTSMFLDMYYITRAFKIPDNDNKSILSIGYFGQSHVERLTYLLTDIMKIYNKKYYKDIYAILAQMADFNEQMGLKVDLDVNYRCIELPEFNLNEVLDTYTKLRIYIYNLENIYQYSDENLDIFLSQFNDQNIYDNISKKRYMAIYYLSDLNLFDEEQQNLIFAKSDIFYDLLEQNSNDVNSLLMELYK